VHSIALSCALNNTLTGPGTYDTDVKPQTKAVTANELKQSAAERYAVLQRKLDDLERIHADGKKSVRLIHIDNVFGGANAVCLAPSGGGST